VRPRSGFWRIPLTMGTKVTLTAFFLVGLAVLISGVALIQNFSMSLEREMGKRALAIAETIAQMESIQDNVFQPDGWRVIQPIAERVRLATNVDYIVILDMEGTRLSHPLQSLIGTEFSGGDEGPSFSEHQYLSRAQGVRGPSIRAFVPLMTDQGTRQVGVVVVGVLTPTAAEVFWSIRGPLYLSLIAGFGAGSAGALVLVRSIKKSMFDMEPEEIARVLEERTAVFQSIDEAVIAVDTQGIITVFNPEARRIIGIESDVIGVPIWEIVDDSYLLQTVETGDSQLNHERILGGVAVIANRIPVKVGSNIVGAVSTFREKTRVQRLAEELTGVKRFVEALRVQNHEHINKLHTVAGLVELKRYSDALDFLFQEYEQQSSLTTFLSENIKDYSIAGLLLGKLSRARELQINFVIDPASRLLALPSKLDASAMVLIIGNLLENAMEAVSEKPPEDRRVSLSMLQSNRQLHITVSDSGTGIPPGTVDRIFDRGFSTKSATGRGIGLYLVQQYVELAGGRLQIESSPESGSIFRVSFLMGPGPNQGFAEGGQEPQGEDGE